VADAAAEQRALAPGRAAAHHRDVQRLARSQPSGGSAQAGAAAKVCQAPPHVLLAEKEVVAGLRLPCSLAGRLRSGCRQ
jgi:hypothetical protein